MHQVQLAQSRHDGSRTEPRSLYVQVLWSQTNDLVKRTHCARMRDELAGPDWQDDAVAGCGKMTEMTGFFHKKLMRPWLRK